MKNLFNLALAALLVSSIPQRATAADSAAPQTVVAIAASNADFSTLVAAVKAAGLEHFK